MEGHAVELLQPAVEGFAQAVFIPEEPRVTQPGRQHLCIPRRDGLAAVGGLDVGDDEEVRGQTGLARLAHGEILLVRAHRGADHLGRRSRITDCP